MTVKVVYLIEDRSDVRWAERPLRYLARVYLSPAKAKACVERAAQKDGRRLRWKEGSFGVEIAYLDDTD
jgi:hypothetical protein